MAHPMTTLYRPVGLEELRLLYEAQMRAFPPRLRVSHGATTMIQPMVIQHSPEKLSVFSGRSTRTIQPLRRKTKKWCSGWYSGRGVPLYGYDDPVSGSGIMTLRVREGEGKFEPRPGK